MSDDDVEVILEQIHFAPADELGHVMSAFCPCNPELEDQEQCDDCGEPMEFIVYRHESMDE